MFFPAHCARSDAVGDASHEVDPHESCDILLPRYIAESDALSNGAVGIVTHEATSGGSHYLFTYPETDIKNRTNIRPGLDVRGKDGYIVVAPSRHVSGGQYAWVQGHAPGEVELAAAPEWLLNVMSRREPKTPVVATPPVRLTATGAAREALLRAAERYISVVPAAVEGGRNDAAFKLAGHLAAFAVRGTDERFDEADILDLLTRWNERGESPLDPSELQQAMRSSMNNGAPRSTKWVDLGADEEEERAIDSTRTRLAQLLEPLELFRAIGDPSTAYVDVPVAGGRETMHVRGKRFESWVRHAYHAAHGDSVASTMLKEEIETLAARAVMGDGEKPVGLRIAAFREAVYVDLGRRDRKVVKIEASGWRVIDSWDCPVRFVLTGGMCELPLPADTGRVNLLRKFINAKDEHSWALILAWLVGCFMPIGAYPILAFHGEHGSAKSTATKFLRDLVDPTRAGLQSDPHSDRDLMISAHNNFVLSYDNLSHLKQWLSDGLCRLSTGAGFATRQLHTDTDQILIEARRPILLNGIVELTTAADLADRTLIASLAPIPEGSRKAESDLREFDELRPQILAGLYTAVSTALRTVNSVQIKDLPRMADFAKWATAAEPALGLTPGSYMEAQRSSKQHADEVVWEAAIISEPLMKVLNKECPWEGTASELLTALNAIGVSTEAQRRAPGWPQTARKLSGDLGRLAPVLKRIGFRVLLGARENSRTRRRLIHIGPVMPQGNLSLAA